MKKTRLLIVRCGAKKSDKKGKIPALQRYTGQLFKTINIGLREARGFFSDIDIKVFILSAEFGLISESLPIPTYNRKMDEARAVELRASTLSRLKDLSAELNVMEIVLLLSSSYNDVLCSKDVEEIWPGRVVISLDGSHQSTRKLGEWLCYGEIKTQGLRSPDEIAEIRRLRKHGATLSTLCDLFDSSSSCIANIVHNRTYKIK